MSVLKSSRFYLAIAAVSAGVQLLSVSVGSLNSLGDLAFATFAVTLLVGAILDQMERRNA